MFYTNKDIEEVFWNKYKNLNWLRSTLSASRKNWFNKARLHKIKRWLYFFDDWVKESPDLFEVAYAVDKDSYITSTTALIYHWIIKNTNKKNIVISFSSKKNKIIKNEYWIFKYSKIDKNMYFWFIKSDKWDFNLADKEKALLDFFYINLKNIKLIKKDIDLINNNKWKNYFLLSNNIKTIWKIFLKFNFDLDKIDFNKLYSYYKRKKSNKIWYIIYLLLFFKKNVYKKLNTN